MIKRPVDSVTVNGIPILQLIAEEFNRNNEPDYRGRITIQCNGCDTILSIPVNDYFVDRENLCTVCFNKKELNEKM